MVVPLEGSEAAQRIMEPRSSASYAAARWSSPQAFVTAGTTGDKSSQIRLDETLFLPSILDGRTLWRPSARYCQAL